MQRCSTHAVSAWLPSMPRSCPSSGNAFVCRRCGVCHPQRVAWPTICATNWPQGRVKMPIGQFQQWMGHPSASAQEPSPIVAGAGSAHGHRGRGRQCVDRRGRHPADFVGTPPQSGLERSGGFAGAIGPQLVPQQDYETPHPHPHAWSTQTPGPLPRWTNWPINCRPCGGPPPGAKNCCARLCRCIASFRLGHQYLVHEGEIVLLDEFTGRMTPGRTLTAGLHQAVEAKEGWRSPTPTRH
jgi:hypothetical protein